MDYKLAIFDLDGTLLDTLEDLKNSLNHALKICGYPSRTLEEVRTFVGNGVKRLVEQGVPEDTPGEQIERAYDAFVCHYKIHNMDLTHPYPGIAEALVQLRTQNIKLAVVTNKLHEAAIPLCQHYFPDMFDYVLGAKASLPKKPAPDAVLKILSALGVSREDAIYIGDSDVDILTAKNAGLPCISVTWGFQPKEKLLASGGSIFADTPAQMVSYMKKA